MLWSTIAAFPIIDFLQSRLKWFGEPHLKHSLGDFWWFALGWPCPWPWPDNTEFWYWNFESWTLSSPFEVILTCLSPNLNALLTASSSDLTSRLRKKVTGATGELCKHLSKITKSLKLLKFWNTPDMSTHLSKWFKARDANWEKVSSLDCLAVWNYVLKPSLVIWNCNKSAHFSIS